MLQFSLMTPMGPPLAATLKEPVFRRCGVDSGLGRREKITAKRGPKLAI